MYMNTKQLVIAIGASLSLTSSAIASSTGNPFRAEKLVNGYSLAENSKNASETHDPEESSTTPSEADSKKAPGKCGAGKCSALKKGAGKCSTGKCGTKKENDAEDIRVP